MEIKVYTTNTCPWCDTAKKYLAEKGLQFEEINVSEDPEKATELIKISGQTGVPVIVINKQVIVGFNKEKIEEALKK